MLKESNIILNACLYNYYFFVIKYGVKLKGAFNKSMFTLHVLIKFTTLKSLYYRLYFKRFLLVK